MMMTRYICENCGGKTFTLRMTDVGMEAVCEGCGTPVERKINLDDEKEL